MKLGHLLLYFLRKSFLVIFFYKQFPLVSPTNNYPSWWNLVISVVTLYLYLAQMQHPGNISWRGSWTTLETWEDQQSKWNHIVFLRFNGMSSRSSGSLFYVKMHGNYNQSSKKWNPINLPWKMIRHRLTENLRFVNLPHPIKVIVRPVVPKCVDQLLLYSKMLTPQSRRN